MGGRWRRKAVAVVALLLMQYNRARERSRLTRSAILAPAASPWRRLFLYGDENSFLTMTGFNRETFKLLVQLVPPRHSRGRGRPTMLGPEDRVGVLLFFLGSSMNMNELSLIFGITPSVCSEVITYMLTTVVSILEHVQEAAVKFPTIEKMQEYAGLVSARDPMVTDVIGFMDGLSLPVQCSSDELAQADNFNSYKQDTMVNNVFAFGPDGKIFLACINYPGKFRSHSPRFGNMGSYLHF